MRICDMSMKRIIQLVCFVSGLLLIHTVSFAQDFGERLQRLAEKNAPGYAGPLVTSLGLGLNSGVIKTAKLHGILGVDITVQVGLVALPDEAKTYLFDASELGSFSVPITVGQQTISVTLDAAQLYPPVEAPTIFGAEDPPVLTPNESYAENQIVQQVAQALSVSPDVVRAQYGTDIQQAIQNYLYLDILPPGANINFFPAASVRGSVGLPMGTEVTGHFVPPIALTPEIGSFTAWGIGGRISLDQFIPVPMLPIDLAAGGFIQQVAIGPATLGSYIVHAEISKKLAVLDMFLGAGYEHTTFSADYDYSVTLPTGDVVQRTLSIRLNGENTYRVTGGLRVAMGPVFFSGEYTMGAYPLVMFSTGISIR